MSTPIQQGTVRLHVTNTDAMKVHSVCQINHTLGLAKFHTSDENYVHSSAHGHAHTNTAACGWIFTAIWKYCLLYKINWTTNILCSIILFLTILPGEFKNMWHKCINKFLFMVVEIYICIYFLPDQSLLPYSFYLFQSYYQGLHTGPFPFPSNRPAGAGGCEITCATLCFCPDTVINHSWSCTSTYNNKDWLLCGGCRPIAFLRAPAKLEVNSHSQTLLPRPQTVSSFRYLSISALSAVLSLLSQEATDCAEGKDEICCLGFLALIVCL